MLKARRGLEDRMVRGKMVTSIDDAQAKVAVKKLVTFLNDDEWRAENESSLWQ